jgi:hypothetical protein
MPPGRWWRWGKPGFRRAPKSGASRPLPERGWLGAGGQTGRQVRVTVVFQVRRARRQITARVIIWGAYLRPVSQGRRPGAPAQVCLRGVEMSSRPGAPGFGETTY